MAWTTLKAGDRRLACVYCGRSGMFPRALSFEHRDEVLSLYRCDSCASLLYDLGATETRPTTSDAIGPETWRSARYVIEAGFSARHVVQCALAALPDLSAERLREFTFVDIGAGFGIASYFVKTTFGMPAVTVEPSFTGKLSADILGLKVHRVYFEDLPPELLAELKTRPCCLHLNSVVEHLVDPYSTLQRMLAALRVERLAVIVPDAGFLDQNLPFLFALPFLSPHDHRHLPSQAGIERFLRRLGFEDIHVNQDPGLLTAVGSKDTLAFPSERTIGVAEQSLAETLLRHSNPHVAEGGIGRLLPIAVSNGNEPLLQELRRRAPYEEQASVYLRRISDRSWDDLPFHLGPSCYWLALDACRAGRVDGALSLLTITAAFADLIAKDHPDFAMTPVDFKWAALLLKANILSQQGKLAAARAELEEILASSADPINGARTAHKTQASAALSHLSELARRKPQEDVATVIAAKAPSGKISSDTWSLVQKELAIIAEILREDRENRAES